MNKRHSLLVAWLVVGLCNRALASEAETLNAQAIQLIQRGHYEQGTAVAQNALSSAEKTLGSDHRDVAKSLNILGELYYLQGQFSAAEPVFMRSEAILEKALGPNDPTLATPLGGLALVYRNQGKYATADRCLSARYRYWKRRRAQTPVIWPRR